MIGGATEPGVPAGGAVAPVRGRRWRWPARVLALLGSGLALWLVLRRLDGGALLASMRGMRVGWYLAGQGLFALGLMGSALRWHLMLRLNQEAVVHGAASVRMVFISQLFNTVMGGPSGGDIPKTALYSRWFGVPASHVLASSVLDRMAASVGGLLFASGAVAAGYFSGGFAFLGGWRWRAPGPWVGWAGAGLAVVLAGLAVWMRGRPESFLARSFRSFRGSIRVLLGSKRRAGHALLCAFLTATLFNVTQVCCLQAVSAEPVPWLRLLWMYHLVTVIAALPVTVAGAGLREGSSMVLLGQYGIPGTTAVAGAMLTLSIHMTWALVGAVLLAREQRRRRGRVQPGLEPTVSVVIATHNDEASLPETVRHVRAVPEVGEVIVADGGSTDGTVVRARQLGCRVVVANGGRGAGWRAGAAAAAGEVVMLVPSGTWISKESGAALRRCLRDPLVVGGGFWRRFRDAPLGLRGARLRCWLRLWWAGRVSGDQALFVRRSALEAAGGVPDQAWMAEVELCRRLRRLGRLALAGAPVSTPTGSFRRRGILRSYWLYWRTARDYRRGVAPAELARRWEEG